MRERSVSAVSFREVILFGLIACLVYGTGAGIRSNIGILLPALTGQSQCSYADVSFCIGMMQLVFGLTQPAFGLLAARTSNRFVLTLGAGFLLLGFAGMRFASSFLALVVSLGILFGIGAGAISFGLVLTSVIHVVGQRHAMVVAGMLNAASGMLGFILSPAMVWMLSVGGLPLTMLGLGGLSVLVIPCIFLVTMRDTTSAVPAAGETQNRISWRTVTDAFSNQPFRMLMLGFSTCGFHMILIESHLFSQYLSYGIAAIAAGWAFSFYGVSTILGALLSGYLSSRISKGRLLAFYYGFRAVWVLIYLWVLPKTVITAFLFSIGLGFTGDATVSPTSGIVGEHFPLAQVATLVGVLFALHQIGAFLSAYVGGILVSATQGYELLWCVDVVLCLGASFASYRIKK
ncbi:MAG: Major facilitator transporter [Succiniclasticum sp.]|jgi:MFS family permease